MSKIGATLKGSGIGCAIGSLVFAGVIAVTGGAILPVLAIGASLIPPVAGGVIGAKYGKEDYED